MKVTWELPEVLESLLEIAARSAAAKSPVTRALSTVIVGAGLMTITLLLSPVVKPAAADEAESDAVEVVEKGCEVIYPALAAPANRVDPLVPDEFKIYAPGGQATVFVGAVSCESVTVDDGEAHPTIWALARVELWDPAALEAQGQKLDTRSELNDYQLWLVSNNQDLITLFHESGEDAADAIYVEDLTFKIEDGKFEVMAPPPTPSPFKLEGRLGPNLLEDFEFTVNHWGSGQDAWWVVKDDDLEELAVGSATGTLEIAASDSMLRQIFCTEELDFTDPVAHVRFAETPNAYTLATRPNTMSPTTEPEPCG